MSLLKQFSLKLSSVFNVSARRPSWMTLNLGSEESVDDRLFLMSDRCELYINPMTGFSLSGFCSEESVHARASARIRLHFHILFVAGQQVTAVNNGVAVLWRRIQYSIVISDDQNSRGIVVCEKKVRNVNRSRSV
jgi:hypothetical protein